MGGSEKVTIDVTVDSSATGTLVTEVGVVSDTEDSSQSDNMETQETTVNSEVDLFLGVLPPASPVDAGDTVPFDLSVANSGPSDAHNVTVETVLPAGATVVELFGCDKSTGTTCTLGNLPVDGATSFSVDVEIDETFSQSQLSATFEVNSDSVETDVSDNSVEATIEVNPGVAVRGRKSSNMCAFLAPILRGSETVASIDSFFCRLGRSGGSSDNGDNNEST